MENGNELLTNSVEDTQKGKYLTFSIETENYGLEIKYVIDIIGIQSITEIPDQPYYVKGVINLRGKIIPTMDIRMRFNKDTREYDDRTCIIVVEINEVSVGIIVDRVLEVIEIENENISLPPKFNGDFQNRYIAGIGKQDEQVMILLDCNKLLSDDEIAEVGMLETN